MSVNKPANEDVFVVDDDPMVLNALTIMLSRGGYHVTGFAEGASFLAAAKARTPACIVLDVHMPGQSGLDILKELNAQQYPAPIFMISGSATFRWPSRRSRTARSTSSRSRSMPRPW